MAKEFEFRPLPGEKPIALGTSAESVLNQILLLCDGNTALLFFRHNRQLYLRIIESPPPTPNSILPERI